MAAVVAPSPSPLSATPSSTVSGFPNSNRSVESLPSQAPSGQAKAAKTRRDRKDRPCDACRRRKSKCVMNEGQTVCAACGMHGQKCTFLEDPRPRKRRVDGDGSTPDTAKRRYKASI